jgi:hypothetical protein
MREPGPVSFLPGFTVEWDPLNEEWLATSAYGRFRIRGRDQVELDRRQWDLWSRVLTDCRTAIAEVFPGRRTP